MRALKITGLIVAAAVAVAVLLLVSGIPGSMIASRIESRVAQDSGYRLRINGATRIGLWPSPHVTLQDIALQDTGDRDTGNRLSIASVQAELPLRSLLSGTPRIAELTIAQPLLRVPLLRERTTAAAPAARPAAAGGAATTSFAIDRITVTDGAIILFNARDGVEDRIDGIGAAIDIAADRRIDATGNASLGGQPVKFAVKAALPAAQERQTIPMQLSFDAPGLLTQSLSASAEVRINGSVLMINSLTGTLGDGPFNGWASADLAGKPLVKLDLDFQKLDIGMPARNAATPSGFKETKPWSDAPIDLRGLNYLDAQLRISATQLSIGDVRFAPAAIDAALSSGVLKANFAKLGAYGGEAAGDFSIDASGTMPAYTLRADLDGARALPLLSGLADFDSLDGRMQAKIDVRSSGNSQHAVLANLDGSADLNFRDGAIRGINLAQMIRALASGTLDGWQDGKAESTDLSQLAASFRIDKGQAVTNDLAVAGPLVRMTGTGAIDLAAKSLSFRVEPRLVLTLQGQGGRIGAPEPVGFGVPVMVQGPWSAPRFYPDVAGILDNPDAAYARLREMGKGLFGSSGGDATGGSLGNALGALIQQGIDAAGAQRGPAVTPDAPGRPPADESQTMKSIMKQLFGR